MKSRINVRRRHGIDNRIKKYITLESKHSPRERKHKNKHKWNQFNGKETAEEQKHNIIRIQLSKDNCRGNWWNRVLQEVDAVLKTAQHTRRPNWTRTWPGCME